MRRRRRRQEDQVRERERRLQLQDQAHGSRQAGAAQRPGEIATRRDQHAFHEPQYASVVPGRQP